MISNQGMPIFNNTNRVVNHIHADKDKEEGGILLDNSAIMSLRVGYTTNCLTAVRA